MADKPKKPSGHIVAPQRGGHILPPARPSAKQSDVSRGVVQGFGSHLAAIGATSVEKVEIGAAWAGAYRFELGGGADWGEVQEALGNIADDDGLMRQVGGKAMQVIAEYNYGTKRRGRGANLEYASMSNAITPEIALNQAASFDAERNYHSSTVVALIIYFR